MQRVVAVLLISVVLAAAQASCPFPQVPPNFQTNFMHRVASSSGNGQINGHIYSDDLHNRTRFDYTMPGSNVNYTVIEFVNVAAKTETEYIITRNGNSAPSCMKHTFPYVVQQDNCTAWNYLGQKTINGQKVLAFLANCTFGTQSYAIEWFWQGTYPCSASATYTPYEIIIQGPGYYSETDYTNFQLGAGGSDSYYSTPSQCSGQQPAPRSPAQASLHSHISYLHRRY